MLTIVVTILTLGIGFVIGALVILYQLPFIFFVLPRKMGEWFPEHPAFPWRYWWMIGYRGPYIIMWELMVGQGVDDARDLTYRYEGNARHLSSK